ncbi:MAG: hypothetical protein LBL08_02910 [Candidatus Nomurabacteria bacterium]|jgi:hypothetical protein|nr:hypothetical protein [Candidatus Nomurabacteria bacterium]
MATYQHTNKKGINYFLHYKDVTLKGGRIQRIYWFAKEEGGKGTPTELPEGYEVVENERNGFLAIRKIRK